jgi:hypothetical protein
LGLCWKLLTPPKPGKEQELETVERRLEHLWRQVDDASEDRRDRVLDIVRPQTEILEMQRRALSEQIDPCIVAGAPSLGIDPGAEAWLRDQKERWRELRIWPGTPPWPEFVAQYMAKFHGAYVVGASRDVMAIPRPEARVEVTGPYGLDASFFYALEDVDDELLDEAHRRHTAGQMLEFKDRLTTFLVEHEARLAGGDGKLLTGLIVCAANWLDYWGGNGFGFEPRIADDMTDD